MVAKSSWLFTKNAKILCQSTSSLIPKIKKSSSFFGFPKVNVSMSLEVEKRLYNSRVRKSLQRTYVRTSFRNWRQHINNGNVYCLKSIKLENVNKQLTAMTGCCFGSGNGGKMLRKTVLANSTLFRRHQKTIFFSECKCQIFG